jgi:hypothetical protein
MNKPWRAELIHYHGVQTSSKLTRSINATTGTDIKATCWNMWTCTMAKQRRQRREEQKNERKEEIKRYEGHSAEHVSPGHPGLQHTEQCMLRTNRGRNFSCKQWIIKVSYFFFFLSTKLSNINRMRLYRITSRSGGKLWRGGSLQQWHKQPAPQHVAFNTCSLCAIFSTEERKN